MPTFFRVEDLLVGVFEEALNRNAEAREQFGGEFRVRAENTVATAGEDEHFAGFRPEDPDFVSP